WWPARAAHQAAAQPAGPAPSTTRSAGMAPPGSEQLVGRVVEREAALPVGRGALDEDAAAAVDPRDAPPAHEQGDQAPRAVAHDQLQGADRGARLDADAPHLAGEPAADARPGLTDRLDLRVTRWHLPVLPTPRRRSVRAA